MRRPNRDVIDHRRGDSVKRKLDHVVEFYSAAPPPQQVLADMKQAGFNVTHLYGLTEVYGPSVVNDWHHEWDLALV